MNKSIVICFICQGGGKYEKMARLLAITTRKYNPNIDIIKLSKLINRDLTLWLR